uniref:RING-type domain-containing protein n=1 Tax=Anopheles minimus TaxID=112268 RepID=A0A182W877_9DIPT
MMSALSHQVNMNNFLSLLVGASLVAANSSPSHDIASLSQPTEFSNGVSSFALPAEERMAIESFTLAYLNYSYTGSDGRLVEIGGNESAKYGEGRVLNRSGILVHICNSANRSDHTGCYKHWGGTLGDPIPVHGVPWIALLRRGGCNFEDKVKHAFEHSAAGVIIYNDRDDSKLEKMKINDKERNITAVFTTKAVGMELIEILEVHKYDVQMRIIEGSRQFRTLGNINRTSVLFVSISFIVLMIISLVWLVFYYVQRFRYLQTKDKQSKRLCSVAKRIIAKIPTKSIKSDDKEIDNDCCAICIEPYKVTDIIRVLPCKHEFHKVCIDPWLLEHRTCPMCKMDILKHYGFVVGSSSSNQINSAIAEYLNVAPPPPPSNTSTITTSSIASTEDSSRRVSWSTGAGMAPTTSATVDGSVPATLFGNNYIDGRNGGTSVGQLTDIVTIIINIDDNESSTGRDDAIVGGSSGTSGGGSNSRMGVLCDLSTHDDVNCSGASTSSNDRDNSNCDSNNANSSDNNESNSDSHLINKQKSTFTGSQESILQLDMDMEEGDLIDDRSSTDGGYQRRNSVSPLPQIRASNENQMSRSSSDSDSEQEHEDCVTPQSSGRRSAQGRNKRDSQRQHEKPQQDGDICVGCLAAALNKKQKNNEKTTVQEDVDSDSFTIEENGSKSLPATLKKYKGNHSTGSCRGMNPPDHYHPYPYHDKRGSRVYQNQQSQNSVPEEQHSSQSSNLPFKFYKTECGQPRKVRTPLRNIIPQSISAPCDTDSSLRVCIHGGLEQNFSEAPTSKTGALHANAESGELAEVHISHRPIDAKRRCSLSRNSSCSSGDRKDVVTCEALKIAIDYSNEEDVSDETEPNSDNDLIIRRSERGDEKETRKK